MKSLIKGGLVVENTSQASTLRSYINSTHCAFRFGVSALFMLITPKIVQAASGPGVIGTGRLLPSVAVVLGLIGVFVSRRTLVNSGSAKIGRQPSIIAIALGVTGLIIGLLHATNAAGGPGTGNGLVGAYVALVLGLINIVIGGVAFAHSKRIITDNKSRVNITERPRTNA